MRSLRHLAVAAVALAVLIVQSATAEALKQVPADTLFIVKVNNLQQVSGKVSKLLNTLGVAQLAGIEDPLAMIKQQMGINAGLKEDGDLVFAYLDPAMAGGDEDESMILLLPVADYAAFLGNFPGAQTEGTVSSVDIQGSPSFVAQWGDYAAVSPNRELVTAAPQTAMTVAAALGDELAKSDAIFYANFEKIRARAVPMLEQAKGEATRQIERELGANEQQKQFVPVAKAAMLQGINAVQNVLTDGNAGAFSLNLSDDGIAIDAIADFKPESNIGKAIAATKGTADPLVRGLPAGDYLLYGGISLESDAFMNLLTDWVAPILKAFAETQPEKAAEADKLLAATKQFFAAAKRSSIGLLAPQGMLGQEALLQQVQVVTGDVAAMKQANQTMAEVQGALFGEMMQGKVMHSAAAKTIDGVQFDETKVELNLTPPAPADGETPEQQRVRQRAAREAAQAQQALAVLYGPQGITQYNAVVGDKFIVGAGVSDEVLGQLVKSAQADADLLADKAHVQTVAAALPQQRVAVVFIPLDQWVKTGSTYAAMFGFPVQLQLPPDLPPIGVAVTTDNATLRIESYIPVDLVQSLVAAGMQAAGGAGMGGGMGDPGGL